MDAVERLINQAVKDGSILGAVLLAKDKSGNGHSLKLRPYGTYH